MTAPTTQKRIIFVGSYMDLFNALQAARENEAVIAAINEQAADDRPAVDEAPFVDAWSLPNYDYLGTRAIVSGGDVIEIDAKEGNDRDIPF